MRGLVIHTLAEADSTELRRSRRLKDEELNKLKAPPVARLVVQLYRLNLPLPGRRTLWQLKLGLVYSPCSRVSVKHSGVCVCVADVPHVRKALQTIENRVGDRSRKRGLQQRVEDG